jgi:hypothetical protein
MPERDPRCPTCKDKMEVGYTRSYGFIPVHWVTGEPVRGWWGGFGRGGAQLPVLTYRCPNCGCLASYARVPAP